MAMVKCYTAIEGQEVKKEEYVDGKGRKGRGGGMKEGVT